MNLTPKQLKILQFMQDYKAQHKYAPTLEETASHFGVSTVTVFEHMQALERKGAIIRHKHKARSAEILPQAEELAFEVPFAGRITSQGIVEESSGGRTFTPATVLGTGSKRAVFQVQGQALSRDMIRNGDYVVLDVTDRVEDGDTVLAFVEGKGPFIGSYRNSAAGPQIETDREDAKLVSCRATTIKGIVISVVRTYRR